MYRRTAGTAVLALLAVIALALAAAGLPSPVLTEAGGGAGEGTGSGVGPGDGPGAGATEGGFERPDWVAPLVAIAFTLLRALGALATLLLVGALVYVAATRREELLAALRDLLARVPSAIAQAAALVVLAAALLYLWPGGDLPRSAPVPPIPGEGGGGASPTTPIAPPSIVPLAAVLGLAAAALVVLWRWRSRSRSGTDADDADGAAIATGEAAEVGRAARRAAERIESGQVPENAVLAAWRDMTALLDGVDRRTATPRQFVDRAVAAGLDRDDVEELTRLFEDVRYGDVEPTGDVERRALRIFRRIETAEADGGEGA